MNSPDFSWNRPASLQAFGAALRAQRERLHLTLDDVAAATGISKPYLSNIETGRAPGPASAEKLEKIARALELPGEVVLTGADWLRTPESIRKAVAAAGRMAGEVAPPRRADGSIDLDAVVRAPRAGEGASAREGGASGGGPAGGGTGPGAVSGAESLPVRPVPLINRVAAGGPAEFTDLGYPAGVADRYIAAPDLPGAPVSAAFALKVIGDSMMPDYKDGEIIIVGPGEARDGDDCVVRLGELHNFATTFKRVHFVHDGPGEVVAVRLAPINPAFAERTVPVEEVTGIYPLLYRLVPGRGGPAGGG